MSVLTVTFNPAIDQMVTLERLAPGEVHRAESARCDAGGKGINVASCLADWGLTVSATGLLGRDNATIFEDLFVAKNIADRFIRASGATRTNIKIVAGGQTTEINLPGVAATPDCLEAVDREADNAQDLVLLSGSLPQGCPTDHLAHLLVGLSARGLRVIVDSSGPALAAVLNGSRMPLCIKPNVEELEEWAGCPLRDIDDILAIALELRARGVGIVAVSMGERGALFCSDEGSVIASLSASHIVSTVGAGDALVAGIIAALSEGAKLERLAQLATAFAVGKLGLAGPNLPEREQVESLASRVSLIWILREQEEHRLEQTRLGTRRP